MKKIKTEKGMLFWFFMFLVPIIAFSLSWLWPCSWPCFFNQNNSQINSGCLACVLFWSSIFMVLLSSVVKKFTVYYKWGIYLPSVWILACLIYFYPYIVMDIREECCSSIRGLNSFIFGFLAVVLIIMQFIFLYNISSKNSIALSENKIHAEAKENPSEGKLINVFWGWFSVIIIFVVAIILLKIVFSLF